MKKTTNQLRPSKLYCDLFGHNYEMSRKVTLHVKEYTCKCCKKQLTTNSEGRLTVLTPKFKEINSVLARIYSNKVTRMRHSMPQAVSA